MTKEELTKLVEELCCRSVYDLRLNTGLPIPYYVVEGFIEHTRDHLLDYYNNNEIPL